MQSVYSVYIYILYSHIQTHIFKPNNTHTHIYIYKPYTHTYTTYLDIIFERQHIKHAVQHRHAASHHQQNRVRVEQNLLDEVRLALSGGDRGLRCRVQPLREVLAVCGCRCRLCIRCIGIAIATLESVVGSTDDRSGQPATTPISQNSWGS